MATTKFPLLFSVLLVLTISSATSSALTLPLQVSTVATREGGGQEVLLQFAADAIPALVVILVTFLYMFNNQQAWRATATVTPAWAEPAWGQRGSSPPIPKNFIGSKDEGGGGEKGMQEEEEGGREMSPPT